MGKSAQKNPPGKSPTESSKFYTTKLPDSFLQSGQANMLMTQVRQIPGGTRSTCMPSCKVWRTLARFGKPASPYSPRTSLTFTRVPAKVPLHSPERRCPRHVGGLGICPIRSKSGRRIERKLGKLLDEICGHFRASFAVQNDPAKFSPNPSQSITPCILSRLLWLKSQNFISASFWCLGRQARIPGSRSTQKLIRSCPSSFVRWTQLHRIC